MPDDLASPCSKLPHFLPPCLCFSVLVNFCLMSPSMMNNGRSRKGSTLRYTDKNQNSFSPDLQLPSHDTNLLLNVQTVVEELRWANTLSVLGKDDWHPPIYSLTGKKQQHKVKILGKREKAMMKPTTLTLESQGGGLHAVNANNQWHYLTDGSEHSWLWPS